MPGARSRVGCDGCRARRRKCDEQKPRCGQCTSFGRPCAYTLKVVLSAGDRLRGSKYAPPPPRAAVASDDNAARAASLPVQPADFELDASAPAIHLNQPLVSLRSLPNGVPIAPRYHKLLDYFTKDVLPSLSCHPRVNEDLCRGLIPAALHSPQLLSACLALSAAGYLSRGLTEVEGNNVSRILGHLQSSGLPLLRTALEAGQVDETLLATCLIWCLAEVFAHREGATSWHIHLRGIKALIDATGTPKSLVKTSGPTGSAMKHLYQLYISLQTLPHVSALASPETPATITRSDLSQIMSESAAAPTIDGFLGYSEELLDILERVNLLAAQSEGEESINNGETDVLLGKLKAMIRRDGQTLPDVTIDLPLSVENGREFALCHRTFQHASLIHIYRRLYHLPSGSQEIQAAVKAIEGMIGGMVQGEPCHIWVAMAMPLFTIGCEAFSAEQQTFVLDKVRKLEECIGSYHVKIIRRALGDVWEMRRDQGDADGAICAEGLLKHLKYHIILF